MHAKVAKERKKICQKKVKGQISNRISVCGDYGTSKCETQYLPQIFGFQGTTQKKHVDFNISTCNSHTTTMACNPQDVDVADVAEEEAVPKAVDRLRTEDWFSSPFIVSVFFIFVVTYHHVNYTQVNKCPLMHCYFSTFFHVSFL